jgi:hypothetical protein
MINESVLEVMEAMGVPQGRRLIPYSKEWQEAIWDASCDEKDPAGIPPPPPVKKLVNKKNWILTTDGKLYEVPSECHAVIYELLHTSERAAELDGWIKASDGRLMMSSDHTPTQSQIDVLFDIGFSESDIEFV